jgi:short-subunit dehydrogenase
MSQVVLITGATSGIGRSTALLLGRKGYTIVAIGRDKEKLKTLHNNILNPSHHLFLECDLSDSKQLNKAFHEVITTYDKVDILINNAGIGLFKYFDETSLEEWNQILNINLLAAVELTKLVLPVMQKQRSGQIINISSVAGKRTWKRLTAYCASKFALIGFSNSLRREMKYKKLPITITVICPPAIKTDFFTAGGYPNYEAEHPGQKLLHPDQVAQAIYKSIIHKKREVLVRTRAKVLDKVASVSQSFIEWLEDKVG